MANITKPTDINKIWSASGDVLAPSDTKISQGWGIEIPPRQYFNYIDNKQDQAIAHINQHGIAVWDSISEYQGNLSYSQGSDGKIYKCLVTNTNINPVGDTTNTWRVAFLDSTSATGPTVATAAQSRAQTDNNTFISPLQLANAFTSASKQLFGINGYQVLPGGLILQWGVAAQVNGGASITATYQIPFPNSVFHVFAFYDAVDSTSPVTFNTFKTNLSTFKINNTSTNQATPSYFAIGN